MVPTPARFDAESDDSRVDEFMVIDDDLFLFNLCFLAEVFLFLVFGDISRDGA